MSKATPATLKTKRKRMEEKNQHSTDNKNKTEEGVYACVCPVLPP
jgi:hypothetical protein